MEKRATKEGITSTVGRPLFGSGHPVPIMSIEEMAAAFRDHVGPIYAIRDKVNETIKREDE